MKKPPPFTQCFDLRDLLPEDDYSKKILDERAEIYAKTDEEESSAASTNKYILFKIGNDQYYGMDYLTITQVEKVSVITPLPNVEDYIVGVYYWHGKIISLVSLAAFLKLSTEFNHATNSYVAITKLNNSIIGIIFDDVAGMGSYNIKELQPQLAEMTNIDAKYVNGIHNGNICILNTNNIISDISKALMHNRGGIK